MSFSKSGHMGTRIKAHTCYPLLTCRGLPTSSETRHGRGSSPCPKDSFSGRHQVFDEEEHLLHTIRVYNNEPQQPTHTLASKGPKNPVYTVPLAVQTEREASSLLSSCSAPQLRPAS
jgi:hypothetical protein